MKIRATRDRAAPQSRAEAGVDHRELDMLLGFTLAISFSLPFCRSESGCFPGRWLSPSSSWESSFRTTAARPKDHKLYHRGDPDYCRCLMALIFSLAVCGASAMKGRTMAGKQMLENLRTNPGGGGTMGLPDRRQKAAPLRCFEDLTKRSYLGGKTVIPVVGERATTGQ